MTVTTDAVRAKLESWRAELQDPRSFLDVAGLAPDGGDVFIRLVLLGEEVAFDGELAGDGPALVAFGRLDGKVPLWLLPVEARAAGDRWLARHVGADLLENPGLESLGVSLPPVGALQDFKPGAFVHEQAEPDWIGLVRLDVGRHALGGDLIAARWPDGAAPAYHPVLAKLLGAGFRDPMPEAPPPERLPLAADGSQRAAVWAASVAEALVVKGPAGSGRTQVAALVAADAVLRGQSALLVTREPERLRERLAEAGLADACLVLAPTSSTPALLDGLCAGEAPPASAAFDAEDYLELRERLDAFPVALHGPVGASGLSPYQALVWLAEDGQQPRPDAWMHEGLADWSQEALAGHRGRLERFMTLLPSRCPALEGVGLKTWQAGSQEAVAEALGRTRELTTGLQAVAGSLAPAALAWEVPRDQAEVLEQLSSLSRLADPPPLAGLDPTLPEWTSRQDDLRRLASAGARLVELRRGLDAVVAPEAWEEHLTDVRLQIIAHGEKLLRHLNADYRRAAATLSRICRGKPPTTHEARVALLDALTEGSRMRSLVRELQGFGERMFGKHWRALESDWEKLGKTVAWMQALQADLAAGRVRADLLAAIARHPDGLPPPAWLERTRTALADQAEAWRQLGLLLGVDAGAAARPFTEQLALLQRWEDALPMLADHVAYNVVVAELQGVGLGGLLTHEDPVRALDQAYHLAVLHRAMGERPALATFSGAQQEIEVARFRVLHAEQLRSYRDALALRAHEALVALETADGSAAGAVVQRELARRERWLPLRQLLLKAAPAVQAAKPVWVGTPEAVALYAAPAGARFERVVVLDADTFSLTELASVITRGRQLLALGSADAGLLGQLVAQRAPVLELAWSHTDPAAPLPLPAAGHDGLRGAVAAAVAALGHGAIEVPEIGLVLERPPLALVFDGPLHQVLNDPYDREVLRARQLERRGLHVHPIWSLDWVLRGELERKRLAALLGTEPEPKGKATVKLPKPKKAPKTAEPAAPESEAFALEARASEAGAPEALASEAPPSEAPIEDAAARTSLGDAAREAALAKEPSPKAKPARPKGKATKAQPPEQAPAKEGPAEAATAAKEQATDQRPDSATEKHPEQAEQRPEQAEQRPEQAEQRPEQAEKPRGKGKAAKPEPAKPEPAKPAKPEPAKPATFRSRPYVQAEPQLELPAGGLQAMATNALARHVVEVVELEGPVAASEVHRRLLTAAGLKRTTAKVNTALDAALDLALRGGTVVQRAEFLWPAAMEAAPVRDRAALPPAQRKLELVAPEERVQAVELAVARHPGCRAPDAAAVAGKLLGFGRPNEAQRQLLEAAVAEAIAAGRLIDTPDGLVSAP